MKCKYFKINGVLPHKNLPHDIFDFKGKVKMKNPDSCYNLNEYYGDVGSVPPDQPYHIYFGRLIDVGQRDLVKYYHLQKRHFIANTSMDAGLSLIMANIGKVKKNDLVFDPFVGSGSLLVACAHHRAYVMGTDIDYLLLYGKVADSSKHQLWGQRSYFDAIITDPPYGIREKTKKIGTDKEDLKLTEEDTCIIVINWTKPKIQRREFTQTSMFEDVCDVDAHIEVDLYQDASFREKYFNVDKKEETKTRRKNVDRLNEIKSNSDKDFKTGLDSETDYKPGANSENKTSNSGTDCRTALSTEKLCETSNSEMKSDVKSNNKNDCQKTDSETDSTTGPDARDISRTMDRNKHVDGNG
ncbi:hypothetical protein KUTeg_000300 [Tegillarca granosa]|uniref:tRNA guanosine-2'-O-methyltransferase TRM11 homolog n=1 Tax=Tegillarca granosa TaxID=220873 RepID=A0ABQ9FX56_TEGGR|nr:hypothetical protein KUTeg_000300 [Tegillarca granosa]